jgi:hypothetical protein
MLGKTTRGVFMDAQKLKEMGASEVVWLATHLSGKKRRHIEEALELVPGQIDRWSSRKDHHTPSLEVLPELIEATSTSRDAADSVIIQWLLARVADQNLKYDPKSMSIEEMERHLLHLGADFGAVATCVIDAGMDRIVTRPEAMRIKTATADIMRRCQDILTGVEPYI